jgi:hypothetical protein
VKFENTKLPIEELVELETRAGELRVQLGMPLLTEINESNKLSDSNDVKEFESDSKPIAMKFDPFALMSEEKALQKASAEAKARVEEESRFRIETERLKFRSETESPNVTSKSAAQPAQVNSQVTESPTSIVLPTPVVTVPVPIPNRVQSVVPNSRTQKLVTENNLGQVIGQHGSTPDNPFRLTAYDTSNPLEKSHVGLKPVSPPAVDKIAQNANPRFRRPMSS